jgi:hypothetical protein
MAMFPPPMLAIKLLSWLRLQATDPDCTAACKVTASPYSVVNEDGAEREQGNPEIRQILGLCSYSMIKKFHKS